MPTAHHNGEQEPLLGRTWNDHDHPISSAEPSSHRTPTTRRAIYIIALCLAANSLGELTNSFTGPAFGELEEGILCRKHHGNVTDTVTDPRCKDTAVQSDLSMLLGVEATFGYLPPILLSVVFGMAAERFGRRPLLCLCSFSMMMLIPLDMIIFRFPETFDIRLIWPVVFFVMCFGGGVNVYAALSYTIISDVTTPEQRTNVFFYYTASLVVAPLFGNPLGYLAMKQGPWFAACIGCVCNLASFIATVAIPETKPRKIEADAQTETNEHPGQVHDQAAPVALSKILSSMSREWSSLMTIAWSNKRLGLILLTTLFTKIGVYVNFLLMQYISKRLSYSWAEANLAITIKYFTKLALVMVILPVIGQVLLRWTASPLRRDLLLAQYSLVLSIVGIFGVGLATSTALMLTSLVLFSLTEGFTTGVRSLLAQLAGDGRTAILFSAVSVLENLGLLVAGPSMAYLFRVGLQWGEQWYGLPFLVAGVLFCMAAIIIFAVRIQGREEAKQDTELDL